MADELSPPITIEVGNNATVQPRLQPTPTPSQSPRGSSTQVNHAFIDIRRHDLKFSYELPQ